MQGFLCQNFNLNNRLTKANTSIARNTSVTTNMDAEEPGVHPFSVRLGAEYIEMVKTIAWWKHITQREFIEQAIEQKLATLDKEENKRAIKQYRDE